MRIRARERQEKKQSIDFGETGAALLRSFRGQHVEKWFDEGSAPGN